MSAAAADAAVAAPSPAKAGRKKLVVIAAVVLLLLMALAAGAVFVLKHRAAQAAALALDDDVAPAPAAAARPDPKHPPTFLPLEPFVVNLADRDTDRYAQIGITLEVDSATFAEEMKAYMPAIRNNILMILAQKTSRELLERAGKEQLASEVQREAVRPMGIVVSAAAEPGASAAASTRKKPAQHNPVRQVHFSNFIIQ